MVSASEDQKRAFAVIILAFDDIFHCGKLFAAGLSVRLRLVQEIILNARLAAGKLRRRADNAAGWHCCVPGESCYNPRVNHYNASQNMINALSHLTIRDKRALAIFFGFALMASLYFASGILVTYVSSPTGALELARDGKGFTVRVLGLQTFTAAEQLSTALQEQRRVPAVIEGAPTNQGYLVNIGPLANRADAEGLTNELKSSGYVIVRIIEHCDPGEGDCNRSGQLPANPSSDQDK
jgi:hypothetical protein